MDRNHRQRSLEDACLCAQLAADFRGKDTLVLDLTDITPIVDYFVITTGNSPRQLRSLADEVRQTMKGRGNAPHGEEGDERSSWILQDYGDIVLHAFLPEARKLYDLEHLWADARRIDWEAAATVSNG
ncbi:MAG: ribosome silencing factor [Planctomycetaceae bacterium]